MKMFTDEQLLDLLTRAAIEGITHVLSYGPVKHENRNLFEDYRNDEKMQAMLANLIHADAGGYDGHGKDVGGKGE